MFNVSQNLITRMWRTFLLLGAGLVLSGASVGLARAGGVPLETLHDSVAPAVSRLQPTGDLPADTNLTLSIGLPLRNREALTNLLREIYDPASTNYHHYLSVAEFTEQFAPSEADYHLVENFAQVSGLKIIATHPNRMLLDVTGKAAEVERAFHVNLRTYHHPTEDRDFFAPDTEPSIPAGLKIAEVGGLDNLRRPHPHYRFKVPAEAGQSPVDSARVSPNATTGSGPGGNYIGDDFRHAYAPGVALQGSGETVALVEFDGYLQSDINAYETLAGRTNIPLENVLIDGFSGVPTGNGGEVEVSLDIEMAVSMAPALAKIIVYEDNPYGGLPNDMLNRIATDNLARQISASWSWGGGPDPVTDQIFQEMALQGQTYFTASTDVDAYPPGQADDPYFPGAPADNPYVTSVGGTTLTMTNGGGAYVSETVWNWDIRYGTNFDGVGSAGGISSYYPIPNWQTNINMRFRGGSAAFRNFPDVAMTADDVLVIADGGFQYLGVGGTSCATPLWAAFLALVNQQATNNNQASIGFLNPALYQLGASTNYTSCFRDITNGNNTWSGSTNFFYAFSNYDLCTGLGAPFGTNLINALAGPAAIVNTNPITHLSPPPPPYGTTLSVLNGGNPNGNWQLFVQDVVILNSGIVSNGWILNLTTANPVGSAADLDLAMTASASTVVISNDVTFTLTVTNFGPSLSSNAIVSDTLPEYVALVSDSADAGTITHSGGELLWSLGNLNPNTGSRLVFTLEPLSLQNLVNYAVASAETPDANPADDFVTTNITVVAASLPQLAAFPMPGNHQFQFSITDLTQQPYVVEASTNLVNWAPVYTNPAPAAAITSFSDSSAPNYPHRFYRVVLQ